MGFLDIVATPFAYIMRFFYNLTGNYVISIFLFTLVFRLIMLPFSLKQQKASAKMTRIQPKIKRVQEKYANNKQKMNEEMQALYRRENYNPMSLSGCLPSVLQLLIIIPLVRVIYRPITYIIGISSDILNPIVDAFGLSSGTNGAELTLLGKSAEELVANGATADVAGQITGFNGSLGIFDISQTPWGSPFTSFMWIIPILAGLLQFAVSFISMRAQKKNGQAAAGSMGCMLYGMSIFSLYLCFTFPAGMGIYWISSSLIMLIQQILINKFYSHGRILAQLMVENTIKRRDKEKEIKAKAQQ